MGELRTAAENELDDLLAFEREYVGSDISREEFRVRYERSPELFVVYEDDGELLGEASGYRVGPEVDDGVVVLSAIGVKNGHEDQGIGRALVQFFEEQAGSYGHTVSLASAANVEGFYRACGYEAAEILVQVHEADLPPDYESHGELLGERTVDPDVRFCYYGFDEYDPTIRAELQESLGAFEANTIYRKSLEEQ